MGERGENLVTGHECELRLFSHVWSTQLRAGSKRGPKRMTIATEVAPRAVSGREEDEISLPPPEEPGAEDEGSSHFSDLLHAFEEDSSLDDAESDEVDAGVEI